MGRRAVLRVGRRRVGRVGGRRLDRRRGTGTTAKASRRRSTRAFRREPRTRRRRRRRRTRRSIRPLRRQARRRRTRRSIRPRRLPARRRRRDRRARHAGGAAVPIRARLSGAHLRVGRFAAIAGVARRSRRATANEAKLVYDFLVIKSIRDASLRYVATTRRYDANKSVNLPVSTPSPPRGAAAVVDGRRAARSPRAWTPSRRRARAVLERERVAGGSAETAQTQTRAERVPRAAAAEMLVHRDVIDAAFVRDPAYGEKAVRRVFRVGFFCRLFFLRRRGDGFLPFLDPDRGAPLGGGFLLRHLARRDAPRRLAGLLARRFRFF